MPPRPLSTERLELIPADLESVDAELHNRLEFQHRLDARVLPGWPIPPRDDDALRRSVELLRKNPEAAGREWYAVVKRHKRVIAGVFRVEDGGGIGCSLLPQFLNAGYEAEAAAALRAWASSRP
ncbi:MAG: hypothetical protein ACHQ51_15120 [Elusimicrobiota bacterium]